MRGEDVLKSGPTSCMRASSGQNMPKLYPYSHIYIYIYICTHLHINLSSEEFLETLTGTCLRLFSFRKALGASLPSLHGAWDDDARASAAPRSCANLILGLYAMSVIYQGYRNGMIRTLQRRGLGSAFRGWGG